MIPASILGVEDEPNIAALLVYVFQDEGYRVDLVNGNFKVTQFGPASATQF